MKPNINPIDIIVHRELFYFEVTNARNFFLPKGTESNPREIMILTPEQGFKTFEDCEAFILEDLQPEPYIQIFCI